MCFSEESSIRSLSAGLFGAALCIFFLGSTTDKIVGLFLGFVSLMQGIEYLLWRHQKCDNYNRTISILGMVLNHLQPFVLGLVVLLVNKNLKNLQLIVGLMIIYAITIIPYSYNYIKMNGSCTLKSENNEHLYWKWNNLKYSKFVYLMFLIVITCILIFGIPNQRAGIIFAIVGVVMYSTSLLVYSDGVAGALWCYYTSFLPLIYFIIRIGFPATNKFMK